MEDPLKASVVIATRNAINTIDQCLSSLIPYQQRGHIGQIIVVAGHSTDGTIEAIKKYPVQLIFDENKGFNAACNLGWHNAREEIVLFIDADAYLGPGFFPSIYEFFSDETIGIVGAQEHAVITNSITKAIGQWWLYHAGNLKKIMGSSSLSWFQRLYRRAVFGGSQITTSGPCYAVRLSCLEAVAGFDDKHILGGEDIQLSRRILDNGWRATWWIDAPLYHYPRRDLKSLIRQRFDWGKGDAVIHKQELKLKPHQYALRLLIHLSTPLLGLAIAVRFKNPLHLLIIPMAHYAWVIGYLSTLIGRQSGNNVE